MDRSKRPRVWVPGSRQARQRPRDGVLGPQAPLARWVSLPNPACSPLLPSLRTLLLLAGMPGWGFFSVRIWGPRGGQSDSSQSLLRFSPLGLSTCPSSRPATRRRTQKELVGCGASQSPATSALFGGNIGARPLCALSYVTALTSGLSYKEEEGKPGVYS